MHLFLCKFAITIPILDSKIYRMPYGDMMKLR